MNVALITKWIAALRSGNHVQGKMFLRLTDGSQCCLGVLCEVAGVPWVQGGYAGANRFLPKEVMDLLGFNGEVPEVDCFPLAQGITLSRMNDSGNYSFDQLADVIEAWLNDNFDSLDLGCETKELVETKRRLISD